jgi:hypothetical protein
MNDEKLMKEAKKRVAAKLSVKIHALTYVCVNAFLVVMYFVTGSLQAEVRLHFGLSDSNIFWPLFPMLGWGLGLAMHGIAVWSYLSGKSNEAAVQAEYQRLKEKYGETN